MHDCADCQEIFIKETFLSEHENCELFESF